MIPQVIIHHSCCGETIALPGRLQAGGGYLVHADGTVVEAAPAYHAPAISAAPIHLVLLGYFNSNNRNSMIDPRQFCSLTKLLQQLLYAGDDLFRQLLYHHRYCPGFKFPWEELEWRLWNMLS